MSGDNIKVRLDQLPLKQAAHITEIHWNSLEPAEARRLQELGFGEGVMIEVRHRNGLFRTGPLACQVGRMMIALRRVHAAAIMVNPVAQS